ncbi:MAG: hypothetical protein Q9167_002999 [Letrouitia subvulpina]
MQTKSIIFAALLSAASLCAGKTITKTVTGTTTLISNSPQQSTAQESQLKGYASTLTKDPVYESYHSILATAVPSAELAKVEVDPAKFQTTALPYSALSNFTALPPEVQSYFNNVNKAKESIITKVIDGKAPKPTGAVAVAGVAAAAALAAAGLL